VLAGTGLALLLGGSAVLVAAGLQADEGTPRAAATAPNAPTTTTPAKPKPRRVTVAVKLTGVAAYDPYGDGRENDEEAPLATDGDAATAWSTERYTTFAKDGVGLVLDAGRALRLARLVVTTDTPGFAAEIRAGATPEGPFARVAPAATVGARTAFAVRGAAARYVVVWVTGIPSGLGSAHVAEVRATRTVQRPS
jgi:hypothetical protein